MLVPPRSGSRVNQYQGKKALHQKQRKLKKKRMIKTINPKSTLVKQKNRNARKTGIIRRQKKVIINQASQIRSLQAVLQETRYTIKEMQMENMNSKRESDIEGMAIENIPLPSDSTEERSDSLLDNAEKMKSLESQQVE